MKKVFVCGLALFFSVTVGLFQPSYAISGGVPKWVTDVPADNENLYFVGIKTGALTLEDGKRSAVGRAITELVEHFETEARTKFHEKRTELETKILDEIASTSASIKINGSFLKAWNFVKTADGRYDVYVLMRYPREELTREKARLQKEAAEKILSARKALRQGLDAAGRGEVNTACASLVEALKASREAKEIGLYNEALNDIKNLIGSMQIEAVSGGAQKGELYRGLKEPLSIKVFLRRNTEIPVRNVPVTFELLGAEGDLTGRALTDDKGYAYGKALNITRASDTPLVRARVDIDSLFLEPAGLTSDERATIDPYLESLRMRPAEFTFEVLRARKNTKVLVLVREENGGMPSDESIVVNELSEALVEAGYDVAGDHEIGKNNAERLLSAIDKDLIFSLRREYYDMADIVVTGSVRTRKGSENLGWTTSYHADGFIKAIDLKSGKIIAQKNLTGVAGFGETEEKAGMNALRKIADEMRNLVLKSMAER